MRHFSKRTSFFFIHGCIISSLQNIIAQLRSYLVPKKQASVFVVEKRWQVIMEKTLTPDEEPAVHQSDLDVNELQCHFAEKATDKLK